MVRAADLGQMGRKQAIAPMALDAISARIGFAEAPAPGMLATLRQRPVQACSWVRAGFAISAPLRRCCGRFRSIPEARKSHERVVA